MGLPCLARRLTAVLCMSTLLCACSDDPEGAAPAADTAATDPGAADTGVADIGGTDHGVADPGAAAEEGSAADLAVDSGPAAPVIPNTPAGAKLQWVLDLVNLESGLLAAADLQANFSPVVLRDASVPAVKASLAGWAQQLAPLEFMGLEPGASDTALLAKLRGRDGKWFHLWTVVEADGAHRADLLWLRAAPLLDATLAPPGADEIVIALYNPYAWGSIAGATVELVDAATGQSFDPPITGTPDAQYSCVALTPPAAGARFGIRATLPDGLATTTYATGPLAPRAPGMAISAPAFPALALEAYLGDAGATADPTKGHLWGTVNHQPRSDPAASLQDWRGDVGCAQVSLGGAGAVVYGDAPSDGRPDPTRGDTDRRGIPWWRGDTDRRASTWWAFNVEPAALTVTVAAGAASVATALPAPRAGEVTVVIAEFARADHPVNPQPAGCQVRPMHGAWEQVDSGPGDACWPAERRLAVVQPGEVGELRLSQGAQQPIQTCSIDAQGAFDCPLTSGSLAIPELLGLGGAKLDRAGTLTDDLGGAITASLASTCTDAACDAYASAHGMTFPCEREYTATFRYFEPSLEPLAELGCDQEDSYVWSSWTHEALVTVRQSATEERRVYRLLADGSREEPPLVLMPGLADVQFVAFGAQALVVTNAAGECQTIFDATADGLAEVK